MNIDLNEDIKRKSEVSAAIGDFLLSILESVVPEEEMIDVQIMRTYKNLSDLSEKVARIVTEEDATHEQKQDALNAIESALTLVKAYADKNNITY